MHLGIIKGGLSQTSITESNTPVIIVKTLRSLCCFRQHLTDHWCPGFRKHFHVHHVTGHSQQPRVGSRTVSLLHLNVYPGSRLAMSWAQVCHCGEWATLLSHLLPCDVHGVHSPWRSDFVMRTQSPEEWREEGERILGVGCRGRREPSGKASLRTATPGKDEHTKDSS